MTLSEYRTTHSWQQAIRLGSQLVRLAEQLPAAEDMGLSYQLRQGMVDLPAAIAEDLIENTQHRLPAALRLVAMLELIEHVYPALDGAAAHTALEQLVSRLSSAQFSEQVSGSGPVSVQPLAEGVTADLPNPGELPPVAAAPALAPAAAPLNVPVPGALPVPPHAPAPTDVPAIGSAPIELPSPAALAAAPMPAPAAPAFMPQPVVTTAPEEASPVHVQPYSGQ
jgi:hypothetical protein